MSLLGFTQAYTECALWSSTDDDGDDLMDRELAPETLASFEHDCACFYADHADLMEDHEQGGHDFWLTRCGHGAGFWDGDWPEPAASILDAASKAYGNVDLYVGDDGLVYSC